MPTHAVALVLRAAPISTGLTFYSENLGVILETLDALKLVWRPLRRVVCRVDKDRAGFSLVEAPVPLRWWRTPRH